MLASRTKSGIGRIKPLRVMYVYTEANGAGRVYRKKLASLGGRRPFALAAHRGWVLSRLAEKPDLTLRALRAELAARGIVVSNYAVWHFLKLHGKLAMAPGSVTWADSRHGERN